MTNDKTKWPNKIGAITVNNTILKSEFAADPSELYRRYTALELKIRVNEHSTKTTYSSPVNFIESMQMPRHRWFPYKEGFSPSFVKSFLKDSPELTKGMLLDPFSGSGTAPIVAGELGTKALGLDVSPLTVFVSKTKSLTTNHEELQSILDRLDDFKSSKLENRSPNIANDTVTRYFEPSSLDALLRAKAYIEDIACPKTHSLFKLALLSSVEPFSTHRKAGNGVKRKTKYVLPSAELTPMEALKAFLFKSVSAYADDLKGTQEFAPPGFSESSSISDTLGPEIDNISCVLTSPPYANCFDYSKIYMSELWIGDFFKSKADQQKFRAASMRSHVHAHWDDRHERLGSTTVEEFIRPHVEAQDLWSPRIGSMLSGYFSDLGKLLVNLKPRLRQGAKLGFVVGNSFYGGIAVATDLLLAELGMQHGYEVDEIRIYRGVIPSSQQYKKLGEDRKYMRESLVVLRRP